MTRMAGRLRVLAACLSGLAGYVDALGFLKLGGFFVSFMSGNSTRLGVGLTQWSSSGAVAGGLVATFVVGVFIGSIAGAATGAYRRPAVLMLVTFLLATAAALHHVRRDIMAVAGMVLAMGAENAVFEENGDVQIGLTYMTGALVKVGQRLALAATGGNRFSWAPYLLLWAGLALGAAAGAAIYPVLGLDALWIASIAAGLLAAIAALMAERP